MVVPVPLFACPMCETFAPRLISCALSEFIPCSTERPYKRGSSLPDSQQHPKTVDEAFGGERACSEALKTLELCLRSFKHNVSRSNLFDKLRIAVAGRPHNWRPSSCVLLLHRALAARHTLQIGLTCASQLRAVYSVTEAARLSMLLMTRLLPTP